MGAADDMGPAAFWWPPDRVWAEKMDNTAPCGSAAGVTNRTLFPLSQYVTKIWSTITDEYQRRRESQSHRSRRFLQRPVEHLIQERYVL